MGAPSSEAVSEPLYTPLGRVTAKRAIGIGTNNSRVQLHFPNDLSRGGRTSDSSFWIG